MKITRMLAVCLVPLLLSIVVAEEAPTAPQPTAQHQELQSWVGKWAGKGELKPGPFGPGGPMSWTEDCDWFGGGRFHVVCKSTGSTPMGPSVGLGVVGYNPEKQVYTHYGVDSTGWSGYAEGTREGNTWTYLSEETMGGQTYKTRMTITLEAADRMTFDWSMSEDGENWTVLMDGVSQKQ